LETGRLLLSRELQARVVIMVLISGGGEVGAQVADVIVALRVRHHDDEM
jgi:nucleoside phosphorylase